MISSAVSPADSLHRRVFLLCSPVPLAAGQHNCADLHTSCPAVFNPPCNNFRVQPSFFTGLRRTPCRHRALCCIALVRGHAQKREVNHPPAISKHRTLSRTNVLTIACSLLLCPQLSFYTISPAEPYLHPEITASQIRQEIETTWRHSPSVYGLGTCRYLLVRTPDKGFFSLNCLDVT
ncbi:hypothetical protein F4810DRAFT_373169 [Camillea tinctor]|nr:hypothetical protein F4810DRAFT_373169 [Camillea tinctor]